VPGFARGIEEKKSILKEKDYLDNHKEFVDFHVFTRKRLNYLIFL